MVRILKEFEVGAKVVETCRKHGISECFCVIRRNEDASALPPQEVLGHYKHVPERAGTCCHPGPAHHPRGGEVRARANPVPIGATVRHDSAHSDEIAGLQHVTNASG